MNPASSQVTGNGRYSFPRARAYARTRREPLPAVTHLRGASHFSANEQAVNKTTRRLK